MSPPGETFQPNSVRQELFRRAGVLFLSPRSPREEAGPLKGSPVSVRLRPGAPRHSLDLRKLCQMPCDAGRQPVEAIAAIADARASISPQHRKRIHLLIM